MELKTSSSKKSYTSILIFILLSLLIFQAVSSMWIKSPTYDEPTHLTSGYLSYAKNDYRYGADHPPFLKSLATFPLLFLEIKTPDYYPKLTKKSMFEFGSKFLFQPQHDVNQIVFLGRLPFIFLSCLLGIYIFLWAKKLYGETSGLFALTLYVFSPNILAYSRLVITDFGVSCFIFITCFYFWNYLSKPSFLTLGFTSFFFGLAQVSKFSALILLPILFFILCVKFLTEKEFKPKSLLIPPNSKKPKSNFKLLFIHFCAPLFIVMTVMFFAYGLSFDFLALYQKGLNELERIYFENQVPRLNYLLGYFFDQPSKLFPIVAFLVKTPIPTLIFLFFSILTLRRNSKNWFNELSIIIPIAFIFISSLFDPEHTGVRRFLPIYPFIILFVSRLANFKNFSELGVNQRKITSISLIVLTTWYIISSARVYPDYLTYFNEAVGGPKNGINYLDNANIDWGQDLKRLKPYMDKAGIDKIKLMYEGTADSKYYGISTIPLSKEDRQLGPQSGYYAISAHYLIRLISIPEAFGFGPGWKNIVYKPIKVIGHTIYIFNINSP
jgi:hypothetical protein